MKERESSTHGFVYSQLVKSFNYSYFISVICVLISDIIWVLQYHKCGHRLCLCREKDAVCLRLYSNGKQITSSYQTSFRVSSSILFFQSLLWLCRKVERVAWIFWVRWNLWNLNYFPCFARDRQRLLMPFFVFAYTAWKCFNSEFDLAPGSV